MSMDSAPATRMTMMTKKASIKLASDGVSLLEGKREALLTELIDRAKELKLLRNDLHIRGRASIGSLAIARAAQGTAGVRSMGVAGKRELSLSVEKEKVWGMDLGTIKAQNIVRTPAERGIGLIDTSSHVLEAAQAAESMLDQLVKCAPLERNIQMIGEEIKKTNRRINALNEYLLPKLRGEVRAIARVLEEREREDTFRLKKIKSKGNSNDVTSSLL
jgi:V/A-type H+-transporting ATPase subunit D